MKINHLNRCVDCGHEWKLTESDYVETIWIKCPKCGNLSWYHSPPKKHSEFTRPKYTKRALREAWCKEEGGEAYEICRAAYHALLDEAFSADDIPRKSDVVDRAYWSEKNDLNKLNTSQAAAALGSIRTPKKSASSRENGKLGGRPKKSTT